MSFIGQYILDDNGNPVKCNNVLTFAMWLEKSGSQRVVGQHTVGDYFISTVFLGLDHNFSDTGPPILYETMAFSSELQEKEFLGKKIKMMLEITDVDESEENSQWRFSTKKEAKEWHYKVVKAATIAMARKGQNVEPIEGNNPYEKS